MEVVIIGIIALVIFLTWGVWILWSICIFSTYSEVVSISILAIFFLIWTQEKFPILRKILLLILGISIIYSTWEEPSFFYINLINILGLFALYKFALVKDIKHYFKDKYKISYKEAEKNYNKEKMVKFIAKKGTGSLINHLTFTGVGSLLMMKYDEKINEKLTEFNIFSDKNTNEAVSLIKIIESQAMTFRYKVMIVYILGSVGLIYFNNNITVNTYSYLFNPLRGIPTDISFDKELKYVISTIDNQKNTAISFVPNTELKVEGSNTRTPVLQEEQGKGIEEKKPIKKDDYVIHGIKTINVSNKESFSSSNITNINKREESSKLKHISFSGNGIDIYVTYPSSVYSGEKFKIKAEMINKNKDAKQGGLTLSFPDMRSMTGKILKNNFTTLKGYSYPNKIFNKDTRKTMKTEYYMVEGWQNKKWLNNQKKYFTLELKAPKNLSELSVNLRGVLWIKNKHDLKEIPVQSIITDQQGFAVKRFSINIISQNNQNKNIIPLKQGMPYSQARKALLNSGWQTTSTRWQDIPEYGRENDFYYKNGWTEVESCSGTGLAYCLFNFHDADGHRLSVVTAGEATDPSVDNWSRK